MLMAILYVEEPVFLGHLKLPLTPRHNGFVRGLHAGKVYLHLLGIDAAAIDGLGVNLAGLENPLNQPQIALPSILVLHRNKKHKLQFEPSGFVLILGFLKFLSFSKYRLSAAKASKSYTLAICRKTVFKEGLADRGSQWPRFAASGQWGLLEAVRAKGQSIELRCFMPADDFDDINL
ncbi:hypothetical protein UY3_02291 [Chelonia mydas]|uniref:Uncharacterized protein n=1 Tax=Chelonia mydas TaxID=8469 RepID=M7BRD7_CHEMY|nr:hypothetical protein UY3_02291 [Chelonia mydas]